MEASSGALELKPRAEIKDRRDSAKNSTPERLSCRMSKKDIPPPQTWWRSPIPSGGPKW